MSATAHRTVGPVEELHSGAHGGTLVGLRIADRVCFAHLPQVIDQLGQWGNYIATLTLADRLGSGANGSTLVALVVVVRSLPSLFLFPAAGVVADRCASQHSMLKFELATRTYRHMVEAFKALCA